MFVVAGCSGPLPNAVPLPLARSSLPVSHHLLHLPEIQSGMENPHPQPIYTSCLTSPINSSLLTFHSRWRNQREHFASGAICKLNREAGENPARPRHCDRGELASTPLTKVGKAVSSTKRESGDLPEAG